MVWELKVRTKIKDKKAIKAMVRTTLLRNRVEVHVLNDVMRNRKIVSDFVEGKEGSEAALIAYARRTTPRPRHLKQPHLIEVSERLQVAGFSEVVANQFVIDNAAVAQKALTDKKLMDKLIDKANHSFIKLFNEWGGARENLESFVAKSEKNKKRLLSDLYMENGGDINNVPYYWMRHLVSADIQDGLIRLKTKNSRLLEGADRTREVIRGAKKSIEEFKAMKEEPKPVTQKKPEPKPEAVELSEAGLNDLLKSDNQEHLKRFLGTDSGITLTPYQLDQIKKRLAILKSQAAKKGAKKTTTRTATTRTNQSEFRERGLLYYGACVVTGTKHESMLESAHIMPFSGNNEELENCMILRADLHNAFDAFDWSINPTTLCIELGEELKQEPCFSQYDGMKLNLFTKAEYIRSHYAAFKSK